MRAAERVEPDDKRTRYAGKGGEEYETGRHSGGLLLLAAELHAHRREHLVGEVVEPARAEAGVEGRAQHGGRHALVDRRDRRPAALAGVRDATAEPGELGRRPQRRRGEVEQPGTDHA